MGRSSIIRDCAIITWKGGRGWKIRGGIGENDNKRERGVGCKIEYIQGGITFSFLITNWKSSGRVIGVEI